MHLAVHQYDVRFGEKEVNLQRIATAIEEAALDRTAPGALLVLPELCATGYQFADEREVGALAEPIPDGPTTRRLLALARAHDIALVAGLAERDGGEVYNAAVAVGPDGVLTRYRKVHLFAEEKRWFRAGDDPWPVFTWRGVRVGLMVCFDWIFPEVARSLALAGAEIIAHPANLVLTTCPDAMRTRSIENHVYTVTANRVGTEARGGQTPLRYRGSSQVTTPEGALLFRLGLDEERLATTEVEPARARDKGLTTRNDLFRDRRPGLYRSLVEPGRSERM